MIIDEQNPVVGTHIGEHGTAEEEIWMLDVEQIGDCSAAHRKGVPIDCKLNRDSFAGAVFDERNEDLAHRNSDVFDIVDAEPRQRRYPARSEA